MTALVVRPIRFTDSMVEMRHFLEILGLRARIESERGTWVDMVAGAGMVALHSAAESTTGATAGQTRLSFEADDVGALASRLRTHNVADTSVYDEAYGVVLTCTDPLGDPITVDGRRTDLYGYRMHEPRPNRRWRVMPVRFTSPLGPYGEFLQALGLVRRGKPNDYYVIHAGPDTTGQVGLHYVYAHDLPLVPGPAAVHLTFETDEALEPVADRLTGHGYSDATITTESFGSMLAVTDPDGRQCQVHTPPAADD